MTDQGKWDAKILAVSDRNPRFDQIRDIRGGWRGLKRAHAEVEAACARYSRS